VRRAAAQSSASQRIDRLIAGITDWRGKTFAAVRKAMRAADPEIVEALALPHKTPAPSSKAGITSVRPDSSNSDRITLRKAASSSRP
jgi:hypothetical protein